MATNDNNNGPLKNLTRKQAEDWINVAVVAGPDDSANLAVTLVTKILVLHGVVEPADLLRHLQDFCNNVLIIHREYCMAITLAEMNNITNPPSVN